MGLGVGLGVGQGLWVGVRVMVGFKDSVVSHACRIWEGVRMEGAVIGGNLDGVPLTSLPRYRIGTYASRRVVAGTRNSLLGVGTDYTKCFDSTPQAISTAMLDIQGTEKVVLWVFCGLYAQRRCMFKINGCLGSWWPATNGIL